MKINKHKNRIIFVISVIIIVTFLWAYSSHALNRYRLNFKNSSVDVVKIILNDYTIQWISRYSLWLSDFQVFCPNSLDKTTDLCKEKMLKYEKVRSTIPKDVVFYRCEWDIIIRKIGKRLYAVSVASKWDILHSGVQLISNSNWWLNYYQWINQDDGNPCYPWNDLENYWKIYWKVSPEEIQSIIDTNK